MGPGGALPSGNRQRRHAGSERTVSARSHFPTGGPPCFEASKLTIPAGRRLASRTKRRRKTKLAKLLCRLYDPQQGDIEIDCIACAEFDLASWRSRMAAAFQDFTARVRPRQSSAGGRAGPPRLAADHIAGSADRAGIVPCYLRDTKGAPIYRGGSGSDIAASPVPLLHQLGVACVLDGRRPARRSRRSGVFERHPAASRNCAPILNRTDSQRGFRHADRICVLERGRVIRTRHPRTELIARRPYRTMFDLQAPAVRRQRGREGKNL